MTDQSLLDYIKQASLKGIEKPEITNELLSVGWGQSSIDEAFKEVSLLTSGISQATELIERAVDEHSVLRFSTVLSTLFGLAVMAPCVFVIIQDFDIFFMINDNRLFYFITTGVVGFVGFVWGWSYTQQLVLAVQRNRISLAIKKGVLYGAGLGAIAQISIYGLSPVLILAMPVGAVIGIVVGVISAYILYFIAEKTMVQQQGVKNK